MGLTMKKIIDKFSDCEIFSLTGHPEKYNITISEEEYKKNTAKMNLKEIKKYQEQFLERYNVTEEEFLKALNKIKDLDIKNLKIIYSSHEEELKKYPDFETLYKEIEKECYDFGCQENREYYLNKQFDDKYIEQLKKLGWTEEDIEKKKKDSFRYGYITDRVGKTTKYGNEYKGLFYNFYRTISYNIDRENSKDKYCNSNGKSPLEQIPSELIKFFKYYEVSFSNSVTISSGLMINYYFELNDETKKYLLKFRNDFQIKDLEDLTLYKNDEEKFYSCTHEEFNSLKFEYQNMTKDEIIDFINDEYFEENNSDIIEVINKLIDMDINTKFSFKEIGVNDKILMNKICNISDKINLRLISSENKEHGLCTVNKDGNFEKVKELPAIFCDLEDLIEKNK